MKKIIILSTLIILGITSCNDDFFEVVPGDKLSESSFWQTEKDAFDALTGLYSRLGERGSVWNVWMTYHAFSSTMTDDATGGSYSSFQNGSLNSTDGRVSGLWKEFYTNIRACNVFLANIDRPEMDENLRQRFTAEARFLRAYYYSLLRNNWGGVPITTEPLKLSELEIPRSTAEEVTTFISNELDDAASKLPTAYGGNDLGRITKGAALALKARTLLYVEKFDEAAQAAQDVMNLGSNNLFQDSNGEGYFTLGQKYNEDNEEIIFAVRYQMPDHGYYYQTLAHPTGHVHEGWGFIKVLQSFVDEFETTDGKTIDDPSSIFDPNNEFNNRDPRLNMAVLKKGDVLSGTPLSGDVVDGSQNTGYYPRKLLNEDYVGWNRYDTDVILIRYAEVLLIYAEAKIESGSIDQTVLDAINDVRARAYGTTRTDIANYPAITTMDQSELRTIVRRERRVELGLENGDTRQIDIRRWRIAENVLNGPVFGAKDESGNYRNINNFSFDASKHYLWPIPQSEIDLIGVDILGQNPGY